MTIAFDCDGCLVNYDGSLRDEVCQLLIAFVASGFPVIVWSGGGKDYAHSVWRRIVNEYNLMDELGASATGGVTFKMKDNSKPELVFDDQPVNLGRFNVCWQPRKK